MKICIITLFGFFNHGNRLQNYALQRALEKLGLDVYTWNVVRKEKLLKFIAKKIVEKTANGYRLIPWANRIRERNFKFFSNQYIKSKVFCTADGRYPAHQDQDIDAFVVGSDQVWNPLFWVNECAQSELNNFFLAFTEKRKIAYASSFGISKLPDVWEEKMKPLLERFDAISVREESGKEILAKMHIASSVVVDPTLLLTADDWRKLELNIAPQNSKYALCYFLGDHPENVMNQIHQDAALKNMQVIDLMDEKAPYYRMGPQAFIELIDKAEIVYTDSFHACVFSILFHTPFSVFPRKHATVKDMGSRITTLLSKMGLQSGETILPFFVFSDFADVDQRLVEIQNEAYCFIRDALRIAQ